MGIMKRFVFKDEKCKEEYLTNCCVEELYNEYYDKGFVGELEGCVDWGILSSDSGVCLIAQDEFWMFEEAPLC